MTLHISHAYVVLCPFALFSENDLYIVRVIRIFKKTCMDAIPRTVGDTYPNQPSQKFGGGWAAGCVLRGGPHSVFCCREEMKASRSLVDAISCCVQVAREVRGLSVGPMGQDNFSGVSGL